MKEKVAPAKYLSPDSTENVFDILEKKMGGSHRRSERMLIVRTKMIHILPDFFTSNIKIITQNF